MLDDSAWSQLLDGLTAATAAGKLRWEQVQSRQSEGIGAFGMTILDSLTRGKIFRATTATGFQTYEIKASDSMGRGPYEVTAWEKSGGTESRALGFIKSSTDAGFSFSVNQRLETLFKAVDASVESSDETVARLLKGLGQ